MNREQRRAAWKRARGNPDALFCPDCGKKSMFVAVHDNDVDHYDVYCEVCGHRLGRTREGHDGVFGEGYIKGGQWKKGDITLKAKEFVNKFMEGDANALREEGNQGKSAIGKTLVDALQGNGAPLEDGQAGTGDGQAVPQV